MKIDRKRNDSGITLIAIVISIIVLIIVASIAIKEGTNLIEESTLQTTETNMLKIQAKVKAYVEEIDAKVWKYTGNEKNTKIEQEFTTRGMIKESETGNEIQYKFAEDGLSRMGISDLTPSQYKIVFDKDYKLTDIIYTNGITYKDHYYTRLSEIKEKE